MNKYIPVWNKRPAGCKKTVSGKHIPAEKMDGKTYEITFYCKACGIIDDTDIFEKWLYGGLSKINDMRKL